MDEIRSLAEELLIEMENLTIDEIEDIRKSWSDSVKAHGEDKWAKVEAFINAICDCGASRAQKRMETA